MQRKKGNPQLPGTAVLVTTNDNLEIGDCVYALGTQTHCTVDAVPLNTHTDTITPVGVIISNKEHGALSNVHGIRYDDIDVPVKNYWPGLRIALGDVVAVCHFADAARRSIAAITDDRLTRHHTIAAVLPLHLLPYTCSPSILAAMVVADMRANGISFIKDATHIVIALFGRVTGIPRRSRSPHFVWTRTMPSRTERALYAHLTITPRMHIVTAPVTPDMPAHGSPIQLEVWQIQ